MPQRLPHLLVAMLALLLVALVVGMWSRVAAPSDRHRDRSANLRLVEWHGTLANDGSLAVKVRYHLLPPALRYTREHASGTDAIAPVGLDLPAGAVRARLDGDPVATRQGGRGVSLPTQHTVTVEYEVPSAARRVDGGTLLDVAAVASLGQLSNDFGYAEVRGLLTLPGGNATHPDVRLPGLRQVQVDGAGRVLAFTGTLSTYDGAGLVALLPTASAPRAHPLPGGIDARFDAAATARSEGRIPDGRVEERGPQVAIAAVVVTIEVAGLAGWAWWLRRRHRRRLEAAAGLEPDERSEPPAGVAPDMVAMLSAPTTGAVATREAVAADVLGLIDRGVIQLHSLDSRRFLLRIPPGVTGATATERLILQELRPQGQAGVPVTLEGPPLWGQRQHGWLRQAERDIRRRARASGLVARPVQPLVLLPAVFAAPLTGLIASDNDARIVAPALLALAVAAAVWAVYAIAAPLDLTRSGLAVKAHSLAYARYLWGTGGLRDLGAPAVLTRGPHLVYGVAVGEAPVAAQDVGVGRIMPFPQDPAARPR